MIPMNLKVSVESRVVAGVLGSSLEFVPESFCAESAQDLRGHNGMIKHDKLFSVKEIIDHSSLILGVSIMEVALS